MIRAAGSADALAITRVHVQAWRHAYGDVLDPATIEDLSLDEVAPHWHGALAEPATRVWVWEEGGAVVGVAAVRDRELMDLYVDPRAQGAGVGTALLDEATAAGACELSVFTRNEQARAFYEHKGWAHVGPAEPWRGNPAVRYTLASQ